jgi:putative ABC transport system permease protein
MGVALVLLVCTGLMIRSFQHITSVDPGFDPNGMLTVRVQLPPARYARAQTVAFYDALRERAGTLPGVQAVGLANVLPIDGGGPYLTFQEQGAPPAPDGNEPDANVRVVDPGYFQTMRIAVREGRSFTERDTLDAPHVAVINETMARKYWPGQDPIGKRIAYTVIDGNADWREIVGIAADVKHNGLDLPEDPAVYAPYTQAPNNNMALVFRTSGDPAQLTNGLRGEVKALDPNLPVYSVRTMDTILSGSLGLRRFGMLLLGLFGALALVLAAVGIYAVLSYSVTQRTHEVGIRMALGALDRDVRRMIVRQGMVLALGGLAVGAVVAFLITRLLSTLLFEVSTADPLAYTGAAVLLAAVALFACYLPARRATKVDPMVALRYE